MQEVRSLFIRSLIQSIHPGPKVFLFCFRNFTKRSFPLTIYRNLEWSGEKYREKGERIKAYIQSRMTRVRLRCLFNIFNHRRRYRTTGNFRWKIQNRISQLLTSVAYEKMTVLTRTSLLQSRRPYRISRCCAYWKQGTFLHVCSFQP